MDVVTERAEATLWPAGFSAATCIALRRETPTVMTFVLRPDDPALLRFEAGQATALAFGVEGERLVRTFSIASAPGGDALEVTIKAQDTGRGTRWLHERLRAGDRIGVRTPRGRFTLAAAGSSPLAFVSAGSGATPLMSMLRALDRSGEAIDVAWHHSATAPDEILFAPELAELQGRHPGLAVSVAVSKPAPGWFGFRGRISRRQLATAVPDIGRRAVFACGPAGFMDEVRLIHAAEGGSAPHFHSESFGAAQPAKSPSTAPAPAAAAGPSHPLVVGSRTIEIGAGETILQGALRQGVVIPCGCGQGLCGTCMVRGVSGAFQMQHQGGLTPDEEREGYLLACSTRLAGPAEIAI